MPVHVLAGNHDDRVSAARELPAAARRRQTSGDYRYATRCGPLRLVAVDTTEPGRDEGASRRRAPGVAGRAAGRGSRDAHDRGHAPSAAAAGHPGHGRDRPAEGRSRGARRGRRRHSARAADRGRPRSSRGRRQRWADAPVFACPSTWMQGRARLRASPRAVGRAPSRRPSRLHVAVAGELVSHVQPIGDWSSRVEIAERDDRDAELVIAREDTMTQTFVIVGAGMAGGKAVEALREEGSTAASSCWAPRPSGPTSARR